MHSLEGMALGATLGIVSEKPTTVQRLLGLTGSEARRYLDNARGDELGAAIELSTDRARRAGSSELPDAIEIHHALFLLRHAQGLDAPSFDAMRVELRRRSESSLQRMPGIAA